MGVNGSNNVEGEIIFDAKEHFETSTKTKVSEGTIYSRRKINDASFTKTKTDGNKFTFKENNLVKKVATAGKYIGITFLSVRLGMYSKQPDQLIKDIEYIIKLFIK